MKSRRGFLGWAIAAVASIITIGITSSGCADGARAGSSGMTVVDVLDSAGFLLVYGPKMLNGRDDSWVVAINGRQHRPEAGLYWIFYVNGVVIDRPPHKYYVDSGDTVDFELTLCEC